MNTSIEQLMDEYAQEHCNWDNIDYLVNCGYRYSVSAEDSHRRCLLFAMAKKLEQMRERVYTLETEIDTVANAGKAALKEAERWINDQLQGTHSYSSAMDELKPVREVLKRYE